MPATLCIHVPDQPALLRVLDGNARDTILGRGADADLHIAHPSVSRRHAVLRQAGMAWSVSDLGSTNGVRIGGHPISERRLDHGDWFSLGDVFCEFRQLDQTDLNALSTRAEQRRHTSGVWLGRLEQAPDRDALLGGLITAIVQLGECRRGFLFTGDLERGFSTIASCGASADATPASAFSGSTAVLARAMHERAPVLISDPSLLDWARGRPSVVAGGLRAMLALPILHGEHLIGMAYADSDQPGKLFTELDRELLDAFGAQAALLLAARGLDQVLADLTGCVEVDGAGEQAHVVPAPRWPGG